MQQQQKNIQRPRPKKLSPIFLDPCCSPSFSSVSRQSIWVKSHQQPPLLWPPFPRFIWALFLLSSSLHVWQVGGPFLIFLLRPSSFTILGAFKEALEVALTIYEKFTFWFVIESQSFVIYDYSKIYCNFKEAWVIRALFAARMRN